MDRLFRNFLAAAAALLLLLCAGCHYVGPDMHVEVVNRSGETMRNVIVQCPVGTFGLPELRNGQMHRHLMPQGEPCKFTVAFVDPSRKSRSVKINLGSKCPTQVLFRVGPDMKISAQRQGRS